MNFVGVIAEEKSRRKVYVVWPVIAMEQGVKWETARTLY
jgi:hypothetical protein